MVTGDRKCEAGGENKKNLSNSSDSLSTGRPRERRCGKIVHTEHSSKLRLN